MKFATVAIAAVCLLSGTKNPVAAADARQSAELVLRGGAVYTVDSVRSWAHAVGIRGGRIVYVGTDAGAADWIDAKTEVIDLQGKMLLPGFHDSHVHLVGGGMRHQRPHGTRRDPRDPSDLRRTTRRKGMDPRRWMASDSQ